VTDYLTPRDIDDFVEQIKTNYLECRVHGHSRVASSAGRIADEESEGLPPGIEYILKTMRCRNRCGIIWREVLNADTGEVVNYAVPDYTKAPYYLTKGMGRLTKTDRGRLRLEHLARWMEKNGG